VENEATKLRRSKGVMKWVAIAGVFAVMAPPLAYAAIQDVKVTNTPDVKVRDSAGGNINSKKVAPNGLFNALGSPGSLDTFEQTNGFLGLADAIPQSPAPSTLSIPAAGGKSVLRQILVTQSPNFPGDNTNCQIVISSNAILLPDGETPAPLLEMHVDAANNAEVVDLGAGLQLTDPLHIAVSGIGGGETANCAVAALGVVPGSAFGAN